MGRPTKLTPERQETICEAIRGGLCREEAAVAAGVARTTIQCWLAKGKEETEGLYRDFLTALQDAETSLEQECAAVLTTQLKADAPEHIRQGAAKFLLERRFRSRWSKTTKVEATGADGGPLQVAASVDVRPVLSRDALAAMTPDELRATLAGARDYLSDDEADDD